MSLWSNGGNGPQSFETHSGQAKRKLQDGARTRCCHSSPPVDLAVGPLFLLEAGVRSRPEKSSVGSGSGSG